MDLIERYVYAVTRRLPVGQRTDVADELRASINDAVDATGSRTNKSISTVLVSLGDPERMALKYSNAPRYVIGPKMYGTWLCGMRYGLLYGVPAVLLISLIVRAGELQSSVGDYLLGATALTLEVAMHIFFWVTLSFFIAERAQGAADTDANVLEWTPDQLPDLPEHYDFEPADMIANYVWYGFLLVLPLLAQHVIGVRNSGEFVPFFNPELWPVVAAVVMAVGCAGIFVTAYKHVQRRWTPVVRGVHAALSLIVAGLLVAAMFTVTVANPAFVEYLAAQGVTGATSVVEGTVLATLVIAIAAHVVDAVQVVARKRTSIHK